jgi:hypothetical protein
VTRPESGAVLDHLIANDLLVRGNLIHLPSFHIQIAAIGGVTHRIIVDKGALKSYLEKSPIVLPDVDDVDIFYDSFVSSFNAAFLVCSHTLKVNDCHFHTKKWVDAELINSARLRQSKDCPKKLWDCIKLA